MYIRNSAKWNENKWSHIVSNCNLSLATVIFRYTHNVCLHERRWETIRTHKKPCANWRRMKIILCLAVVVLWNCAYFGIKEKKRQNQSNTFAHRGRKKWICFRLNEISDGRELQCAQVIPYKCFSHVFFLSSQLTNDWLSFGKINIQSAKMKISLRPNISFAHENIFERELVAQRDCFQCSGIG